MVKRRKHKDNSKLFSYFSVNDEKDNREDNSIRRDNSRDNIVKDNIISNTDYEKHKELLIEFLKENGWFECSHHSKAILMGNKKEEYGYEIEPYQFKDSFERDEDLSQLSLSMKHLLIVYKLVRKFCIKYNIQSECDYELRHSTNVFKLYVRLGLCDREHVFVFAPIINMRGDD